MNCWIPFSFFSLPPLRYHVLQLVHGREQENETLSVRMSKTTRAVFPGIEPREMVLQYPKVLVLFDATLREPWTQQVESVAGWHDNVVERPLEVVVWEEALGEEVERVPLAEAFHAFLIK